MLPVGRNFHDMSRQTNSNGPEISIASFPSTPQLKLIPSLQEFLQMPLQLWVTENSYDWTVIKSCLSRRGAPCFCVLKSTIIRWMSCHSKARLLSCSVTQRTRKSFAMYIFSLCVRTNSWKQFVVSLNPLTLSAQFQVKAHEMSNWQTYLIMTYIQSGKKKPHQHTTDKICSNSIRDFFFLDKDLWCQYWFAPLFLRKQIIGY